MSALRDIAILAGVLLAVGIVGYIGDRAFAWLDCRECEKRAREVRGDES